MLKAEGYSVINSPGERSVEHDTLTCGHCGFITFTAAGGSGTPQLAVIQWDQKVTMRDVHRCRKCWRYICPKCEKNLFECTPYEAKIEQEERAARRLILP